MWLCLTIAHRRAAPRSETLTSALASSSSTIGWLHRSPPGRRQVSLSPPPRRRGRGSIDGGRSRVRGWRRHRSRRRRLRRALDVYLDALEQPRARFSRSSPLAVASSKPSSPPACWSKWRAQWGGPSRRGLSNDAPGMIGPMRLLHRGAGRRSHPAPPCWQLSHLAVPLLHRVD